MLKSNRRALIEDTIGTGLPTLLAKNLKLVDVELPEKGKRHDSDITSLSKIRELFGKGKIEVTPKREGAFEIKVPGGIVILEP